MRRGKARFWTPDRVEQLRTLFVDRMMTFAQITAEIGEGVTEASVARAVFDQGIHKAMTPEQRAARRKKIGKKIARIRAKNTLDAGGFAFTKATLAELKRLYTTTAMPMEHIAAAIGGGCTARQCQDKVGVLGLHRAPWAKRLMRAENLSHGREKATAARKAQAARLRAERAASAPVARPKAAPPPKAAPAPRLRPAKVAKAPPRPKAAAPRPTAVRQVLPKPAAAPAPANDRDVDAGTRSLIEAAIAAGKVTRLPAAHAAGDIRHESQMGNWREQKRREKQRLGIS